MPFKAVFETALSDVWTATEGADIGDKPGDIRWERTSEGMKCFKCIIYDTGDITVAGVAGEATEYYTMDGYKNHTVTSDYSVGVNQGAGILQAIMVDTERGWVQIKGFATLTIDLSGAPSDGEALTTSGAGDGALDQALSDVSAAALVQVCAYACDDSDDEIICDFTF